jgi:hypothetical protein
MNWSFRPSHKRVDARLRRAMARAGIHNHRRRESSPFGGDGFRGRRVAAPRLSMRGGGAPRGAPIQVHAAQTSGRHAPTCCASRRGRVWRDALAPRRSTAAFSFRRRAALSPGGSFFLPLLGASSPHRVVAPPSIGKAKPARVSQLLAGTHSGSGRSPDAARVRGLRQPRPRAPHPVPLA